tara:strand:- start:3966 stop:4979 length:1014 start_codon:yes stop_codon:yes gene_type:complete
MLNNQKKVLITGASGYIARQCISDLLKSGYRVKGSLRDLSKSDEVINSLNYSENKNLEFCKLDLLKDDGWVEAASDCEYLMHLASPFIIEEPKDEQILIKPALEGTLRALKAANKTSIKKVVLTSSMASIAYGHKKKVCNPNDWTAISKDVGAYIKSKTIAEKAAWDYFNKECNNSFSLTTIHPGMVFGPILSKTIYGASVSLILDMIRGKYPALPDVYFTVVDVRDVSRLHVKSLENSESNNKRIIATSQEGISFLQISNILRNLGFDKSPKNLIPKEVINSLAPFNKKMRSTSSMIKRGCYGTDLTETKNIFNWDSISLEKTLKDMTQSFKMIQI